jgi:N-glycosylase/DNA lyase
MAGMNACVPAHFRLSLPTHELDLGLCVSSGQVFRWERLPDGRWLGAEGPCYYLVREEVVGDALTLDVESNGSQEDFERLFRLETSLAGIEERILRNGPELEPYVQGLPGLRVLRQTWPHETLFTFLCTPNNHLGRITQMVRKLAEYGEPLAEVEGRLLHRFPSPAAVADIPEEALRAKGFGYRARTIPRAARQLLELPGGWLEGLRSQPYAEARQELMRLEGVGPKLADCIALFGLHHLEAVPVDTHLWQAACRLYFPEWGGKAVTGQRYDRCGDALRARFGDLAGWAHQYLFYENLVNWRSRRSV